MSYKIKGCTRNDLKIFNEFVITQNHIYYNQDNPVNTYTHLLDSICSFERFFYDKSIFFIARDENNNIIGTIRSLLWDNSTQLPIETIFGVNLRAYFRGYDKFKLWHIGRFAIEKRINSISLLKDLILKAISPIVKRKSLGAVSECDEKLLRVLNILGIESRIIAPAKEYLGSNTIPVFFSYETLCKFYVRNTFTN